jgi:hypothetical protein
MERVLDEISFTAPTSPARRSPSTAFNTPPSFDQLLSSLRLPLPVMTRTSPCSRTCAVSQEAQET